MRDHDTEAGLIDRRTSSRGCSTLHSEPVDDSGGSLSGEPRWPRRTPGKRKGRRAPLGSILATYLAGKPALTEALEVATPFQYDWLQQAVGAVNGAKHLLAGAMSAILSKTATAPLERIKMEMQLKQRGSTVFVAKKLLGEGGLLTFWRGNGMNLLRVTPHKAVNFYSFYVCRTGLQRAFGGSDASGTLRFIAGALAGSTATLTCLPLDVIRTRMLSWEEEKYRTAFSTFRAMLREESVSSLYVGCVPAIVSTAASGAIFYGVYDLLKDRYLRRCAREGRDVVVLGAGRTMLYGALAGAAAESILYPLELLRRRMQLQSMQATEVMIGAQRVERMTLATATENGLFATAKRTAVPAAHRAAAAAMRKQYLKKITNAAVEIYKMDGVAGFYQGFAPHICQVLPSAALSYYFYEACKRALNVRE